MNGCGIPGGRALFLVGFMGSGKTAVGQIVARRLGCAFLDTDEEVERVAGRSIEQIFAELGEGHFRELEWRALRELGSRGANVIATGGGLFLGLVQRRFMRERGRTVWLDAPLETIRARIGSDQERPLWIAHDPLALRALFEKRRATYALADARVDASGEDPEAIARQVLVRIGWDRH